MESGHTFLRFFSEPFPKQKLEMDLSARICCYNLSMSVSFGNMFSFEMKVLMLEYKVKSSCVFCNTVDKTRPQFEEL